MGCSESSQDGRPGPEVNAWFANSVNGPANGAIRDSKTGMGSFGYNTDGWYAWHSSETTEKAPLTPFVGLEAEVQSCSSEIATWPPPIVAGVA